MVGRPDTLGDRGHALILDLGSLRSEILPLQALFLPLQHRVMRTCKNSEEKSRFSDINRVTGTLKFMAPFRK
jgi:hypothetical protein